jgi:hypothetical protein
LSLRSLGSFLSELPVTEWVQLSRSTIRLLGLVVVLLFLAFCLVLLLPDGFSPDERLWIFGGIGVVLLVVVVAAAVLTGIPGDRLYAPWERAMSRGRRYGTKDRQISRAEVLELAQEPSAPSLPAPPDAVDEAGPQ